MKFPHYRYDDMVRAQYLLVRDGLRVDHLRLVMGTSQGGMHTWLWGITYPEFMDALMPLASAPVEIVGRNRMTRTMAIQAIKNDPDWKNGEYDVQPRGLIAARAHSLNHDRQRHAVSQGESDRRESRFGRRGDGEGRFAGRRERHDLSV
jgi:homoserine O-acetyltransferase